MTTNVLELPRKKVIFDSLPSKGKPYPATAEISYRTYTFGEVKNNSISDVSIADAIRSTLKCIEVTGMSIRSLTIMDTFYIGLMIHLSTLGNSKFTIPYVCWKCGHEDKLDFTLIDIETNDISEKVTDLPVTMETIDGKNLEFMPLTVGTYLDISSGKYSKTIKDMKDGIASIAGMVINHSYEEAYKILNTITDYDDMENVKLIDSMLMHSIKPLSTTCKNTLPDGKICNADLSLKLEGRSNLIIPCSSGNTDARRRVHFGAKNVDATIDASSNGVPTRHGVAQEIS